MVSIHAPVKGATTHQARVGGGQAGFNPRAREGRDKHLQPISLCHKCFNPRAREGRDPCWKATAPGYGGFNPRAREGRDVEYGRFLGGRDVSIHAPVKGATPAPLLLEHGHDVSIHAPVKGATCARRR